MMMDGTPLDVPLPFSTAGAADKSGAFRAAARHSRHVRLMRRLLVGGGLAGVAGLALYTFDPFGGVIPAGVSVASVGLDGTRVTMSHPRLSGYRNDGRPYQITASEAVQDLKTPTRFELHDMDARLTMQDSTVTHLTSAAGTYDSKQDLMDLTSQVLISSDAGLDVRAQDAHVEFRSGSVVTRNPVSVAMRGNTIAADGMRMVDNGRQVTFEGHVRTTFAPADDATPAAVPQAAAPAP